MRPTAHVKCFNMIVTACKFCFILFTVHHNFSLTTYVSAIYRIPLISDSEWSLHQQALTKEKTTKMNHK